MNEDVVEAARATFTAEAEKRHRGNHPMVIRVVEDPALAVPGFVTLEATAGTSALRAWVRGETIVLAPLQNFAPVLEALSARDKALSPSTDRLANMFAWLHGPEFARLDHVPAGYRGASEEMFVPPDRWDLEDGTVEIFFTLDMTEDETHAAILQYHLRAPPGAPFELEVRQLAP